MLSPLYAEIVLDLEVRDLKDRLFTYRVPEFLLDEVFVGAQVLVPFGHQETVGGYVISLLSENKSEFKLKDIAEVIEPEPLFGKDYIDFLNWLAFKSCARLNDVIQAAIPASLAPRIKRSIRMSKTLKAEDMAAIDMHLRAQDRVAHVLMKLVAAAGTKGLALKTLKKRFQTASPKDRAQFFKGFAFLKREGVIEIVSETGERTGPKLVTSVTAGTTEAKTARQKEILQAIEENNGIITLAELVKSAGTTYGTIQKLGSLGMVALKETEVLRDPMKAFASSGGSAARPQLTDQQEKAVGVLREDLTRILETPSAAGDETPSPWLLHGVTGSGKTEVYMQLIEEALRRKRTALLLVPEISLTPQLASRLKDRFGNQVSIWHSAISAGERYDTWRRLSTGDVTVLLGARSAILAHMPDLGLIILDEEHDSSYKQSSPSPRYNAKEVALEKGRRQGAMVVFGSATPDVVSYNQAVLEEKLLELPDRVHKQEMPEVKVIDMRDELRLGNRSILSQSLRKAIEDRLEKKEQIILLINRRGYANHVFCRACGYVARCKHCSVSLVYHLHPPDPRRKKLQLELEGARKGYLACHHCGYERHGLKICPTCQSPFIKEFGLGTQQVEEIVQESFPSARLVRLDSDITRRKGAYKDIFEQFQQGDADILIGTQMVAKGLDVANVTLVGVLVADASLNMPDYRSTERGFQLLSQVSGRAGRGQKPGKVILQTYNPDLPVLALAKAHDYKGFSQRELEARKAFSYPPFSRIIRIVLTGIDPNEVESTLEKLAEEIASVLEDIASQDAVQILGPSSCIIEKVKNKFRFHLLLKVKGGENIMDPLLLFLRNKKVPKQLSMAVDVDALDLL